MYVKIAEAAFSDAYISVYPLKITQEGVICMIT